MGDALPTTRHWKRRIHLGSRYALAAAGYHSKPAFLGIGAQKAGTSALFDYLSLHPQIVPGSSKELHFFCDKHERGLNWYHSHFPLPARLGDNRITFEVTPHYLFAPAAAERIHRYNPALKLIVVLRNPVERAFSAWNMPFYKAYDYSSFDAVVEQSMKRIEDGDLVYPPTGYYPDFVHRGLYYDQLQRYFAVFDRQQVLVARSDELKRNPAQLMHRITTFLGLREHAWERETFKEKHVGTYSETMNPATRERLSQFFRPHNEKLYELLGVDYGWT